MDSAWDRMLDLVEHYAIDPTLPLGREEEQALATLATEARSVGDVDSELHVDDVARWLVGLARGHRGVREDHPDVHPDDDLADLRVIITRWLHPARPR